MGWFSDLFSSRQEPSNQAPAKSWDGPSTKAELKTALMEAGYARKLGSVDWSESDDPSALIGDRLGIRVKVNDIPIKVDVSDISARGLQRAASGLPSRAVMVSARVGDTLSYGWLEANKQGLALRPGKEAGVFADSDVAEAVRSRLSEIALEGQKLAVAKQAKKQATAERDTNTARRLVNKPQLQDLDANPAALAHKPSHTPHTITRSEL